MGLIGPQRDRGARSGGDGGRTEARDKNVSETKEREGDRRGRWRTKVRQAGEKETKEAEHAVASLIPRQSSESRNSTGRNKNKGAPFPKKRSEIISLCPKETRSPYMCADVWAQDWGLNGSRSAAAI